MSNKKILKLVFTALTYIWRGGPGSGFVRAGIRSRAGVVEENLIVITSGLKKTK